MEGGLFSRRRRPSGVSSTTSTGKHAAVHQTSSLTQCGGMLPVARHGVSVDLVEAAFPKCLDGFGAAIDKGPDEKL